MVFYLKRLHVTTVTYYIYCIYTLYIIISTQLS